MELTRLANKYDIVGLESVMAQYIKDILLLKSSAVLGIFDVNTNTRHLIPDHIASATLLPRGHPVRRVLAAASVAGYLRSPEYRFSEETQIYPSFGADLLQEVRVALQTVKSKPVLYFEDPISGTNFGLNEEGQLLK